jgi:hypothetical protein
MEIGEIFDASLPFLLKASVPFMTTDPISRFTQHVRSVVSVLLFIAAGLVVLGRMAIAQNDGIQGQCDPVVIAQFFDDVTPPALPPDWSSTTWVTSNSGLPSPPADSWPNAAFVDDPPTIGDKQLLSSSIPVIADSPPARVSFRNNFNLQDGFDGGVLEISFDDGLTFQDILAAGGTFRSGGYNGTISTCCGNPLAGREAWTGNSGGFIATTVNLPYSSFPIIMRWRLGSDGSVSGEGWRIDSVVITLPCPTPPFSRRPHPTPHPRPTPP